MALNKANVWDGAVGGERTFLFRGDLTSFSTASYLMQSFTQYGKSAYKMVAAYIRKDLCCYGVLGSCEQQGLKWDAEED